jgi:hypothetical protein
LISNKHTKHAENVDIIYRRIQGTSSSPFPLSLSLSLSLPSYRADVFFKPKTETIAYTGTGINN